MTEDEIKLERRKEQKELVKDALKEGLRDWLDDRFAQLGRWTLRGIGAMGFFLIVYFWLTIHGWKAPQITP